jgi:hypothetical protein
MRALHSPAARRYGPAALALGMVVSVLAALTGLVTSSAQATTNGPVRIVIDSVTSDVAPPEGTPGNAVPYVLVQAGDTFRVHVSFYDAAGAPASFKSDTALAITTNRGAPTPSRGTAKKGETTATLAASLPTAANQVSVTVSVAGGKEAKTVAPGTTTPAQSFDVVSELQFVDSAPDLSLEAGIGGDDSSCTIATKADPVCGIVILPHGALSGQVLLSLGLCDASYAACGSTRGSVVQTLGNLSGLYSKTDPATLLMKCDKSLCGGGAIRDQHLSFSLNGNDALSTAEPCPAKQTIGDNQQACVDYVQSKRDGSGDTYLYLLFSQDMRGSVG